MINGKIGKIMNRLTRINELFEYIKQRKVCEIQEIQQLYDVSLATLHRDLSVLKNEGKIEKFYGEVAIKVEQNYFNLRKDTNIDLKQKVAQRAIDFITEGDCVFLDNSTTVYYLAMLLCESSFQNVVVVSNNAFIYDIFLMSKNINFVSTGGILNKDLNCYVGTHALDVINDFNANKYFFSCSGLSLDGGISDIYAPDEYFIKKKMLNKSKESLLLVDSTKIGKTSIVKWFNVDAVDYIITDNKTLHGEITSLNELSITG
jgi:DeoR family myo-inositol catabolism operon transcriptional repressor